MSELPQQSGKLDINIEDNVNNLLSVIYKIDDVTVDVTGYTATFELRDVRGQTGDALLSLTEASGITIGTTDGAITVTITDAQSTFGDRAMVYDLIVTTTTGVDVKLLRGKCQSHAGVVQ